MNPEAIFAPMLGVMALTFVVWVWMYALRIPAMKRARKPTQFYTSPSTIDVLEERANYPAYNFRNLFELPVLFYVLCLYLHAIDAVDAIYVTAAWVFFATRVLHSIVQCTSNIVVARFTLYCMGAAALFFMLGRAIFNAL